MNEPAHRHFACFNAFISGGWYGRVTPTASALYFIYLKHADTHGVAYPGLSRLESLLTPTGKRGNRFHQIRVARKELVRHGLLTKLREGGGNQRHTAQYRVNVPAIGSCSDTGVETSLPAESNPGGNTTPVPAAENMRDRGESPTPKQTIEQTSKQTKARQPRLTQLPEIPDGLNTEEFKQAWAEWLQHRSEKRKPVTPLAAKKQFDEMAAWGPARAARAIDHSIRRGWLSIYEPDGHSRNGETTGNTAGNRVRIDL